MDELWTAMIVLGSLATGAMIIALVIWKVLPQSSSASFNGKQWKLGGAFAAFVFVWFSGFYLLKETVPFLQSIKDTGIVAEVIHPPNERQRYQKLFSDLDPGSSFRAYNAPFAVETHGSRVFWEDAINLHVKRYNSGVNSRYLFFRADSYERASAFFSKLKAEIKENKFNQQIEIAEMVDSGSTPCNSFFLAKQNGKKVVIFYPEPYKSGGVPDRVIRLIGADKLYDEYWNLFASAYAVAEARSREDTRRRDPRFKGY